jgi:hypothetical protein
MRGSWYLTGTKVSNQEFSWRLSYTRFSLVDGCALTISLDITPHPKVRNRAHTFRLLEDYRRTNRWPWLEEVRVEGNWCKCLLDLEKLSTFVRPLLDTASIDMENEGLTVSEDELLSLHGRIMAPCAPTYWGQGDINGIATEYLSFKILIYFYQLNSVLPAQWQKIRQNVRLLIDEHPAERGRAFLIMRLGQTRIHDEIACVIRKALLEHGIVTLRADDREYCDDLFENVLTYMYGCEFGVAVFERIEKDDFNPNVTLEVGYMMALGKPVCLLKDATLQTLSTDLSGKLYREFEPYAVQETVPKALASWLTARRLI